jgi:RNA polymerase sigma-70 factor, ECF subfamily
MHGLPVSRAQRFPPCTAPPQRPLPGAGAVARFAVGSLRFLADPFEAELTEINGEPAVILRNAGRLQVVVAFTFEHERIVEMRAIGNPDKLRHLP